MMFGDVDERTIASRDITVLDEALGFHRRIRAGKPVPVDLQAAYDKAAGKGSKAKSSKGSKAPAEPAAESSKSGDS